MKARTTVLFVALGAACLVACGPKAQKPPDGPPPEYEAPRQWTADGKPIPRGSAAPSGKPAAPPASTPKPLPPGDPDD